MFQLNYKGFTPYINFGRIFRRKIFSREASRSCITGFTLIEVVVAISVLIVGVLGVFIVVQDIIFSSQLNSSRLTATYLAQEGIELVRNQRDTNWLAGIDWDSELSIGTTTENGLLGGKFNRITTIDKRDEDGNAVFDKIIVEVRVSWQERGRDYSVTAETELYKWR